MDGLHGVSGRIDVLVARGSKCSAPRSKIDLPPGGSLEEHSHEASDGVSVSLGNQEVLDGSSGLPGVLVSPVLLEVAGEVLSGGVPGKPSELSGLDEPVFVGSSGAVVGLGVKNQAVDVVNVLGVGLNPLDIPVEVSAEVSASNLHGLEDGEGLSEIVVVPLSNLGELVLVEGESEPLVGVLPSGVECIADDAESHSVLLEGGVHSSDLLVLSAGPVKVDRMHVRLLAPQPVAGNWDYELVVPGVVRKVLVSNHDLGDAVGDANRVDDFLVDGGEEFGCVPVFG